MIILAKNAGLVMERARFPGDQERSRHQQDDERPPDPGEEPVGQGRERLRAREHPEDPQIHQEGRGDHDGDADDVDRLDRRNDPGHVLNGIAERGHRQPFPEST